MTYIKEDSSAPYGLVVYDKEHDKKFLLDKSVAGDPSKVAFPSWVAHRMVKRDKLRNGFDRKVVELGEAYDSETGVDLDTLDIWEGTKNNPKNGDSTTRKTTYADPYANFDSAIALVENVLASATEAELGEADLDTDIIASVVELAKRIVLRERSAVKAKATTSNMEGLKDLGWSKEQLLAMVEALYGAEESTEESKEESKE